MTGASGAPATADVGSPTSAVITLCSAPRLHHLLNQLRAVTAPDVLSMVVWLDDTEPPTFDDLLDGSHSPVTVIRVPPGQHGLRLAAARNAGAEAAISQGVQLLVFLDADCIPSPTLLARYLEASGVHPSAVLSGPVTYLPADAALDPESLVTLIDPHPLRPSPAAGSTVVATAEQYPLFWSLSFALTPEIWRAVGGFDERYEGYGGEDTDFAFRLRETGTPLVWVGGAHAYHQHHPTSSPPWQHLDDILRNARIFAERWGQWPMGGWLDAFATAGAIEWHDDGWRRTGQ